MTHGSAKTLWLVTAGLATLYLAVWAAGVGRDRVVPPQTARLVAEEPTPDQAAQRRQDALQEAASADAAQRVDSRATLEVAEVEPKYFEGSDLRLVAVPGRDARLGSIITLIASVDGEPVSKLTYHAAPPDTVVFVRQEEP